MQTLKVIVAFVALGAVIPANAQVMPTQMTIADIMGTMPAGATNVAVDLSGNYSLAQTTNEYSTMLYTYTNAAGASMLFRQGSWGWTVYFDQVTDPPMITPWPIRYSSSGASSLENLTTALGTYMPGMPTGIGASNFVNGLDGSGWPVGGWAAEGGGDAEEPTEPVRYSAPTTLFKDLVLSNGVFVPAMEEE